VVFRKLQKDFQRFLRANNAPKEKPVKKPKIKSKKVHMPKNHFELVNAPDSISKSYTHRVGRMNDWNSIYGQGMYE